MSVLTHRLCFNVVGKNGLKPCRQKNTGWDGWGIQMVHGAVCFFMCVRVVVCRRDPWRPNSDSFLWRLIGQSLDERWNGKLLV